MNKNKLFIGLIVLVALGIAFSFGGRSNEKLGGLIHTLQEDFRAGISVGGTETISKDRALSVTSITNSGTTTLTGATAVGSVTAGLTYYKPVVDATADATLTIAQTGSIFNIGTAGVDLTLPAPTAAKGVHYRFVVSAAFATTDATITVGNTDLIEGSLIVAGAVVACDAADTITIAAANEDIGDFIDLYSNGVKWMIGANQAMTAGNHACSG